MDAIGQYLIIIGLTVLIFGIFFSFFSRFGLPILPGDILIKKENFTFYFPVATSILISLIVSVILFLLKK